MPESPAPWMLELARQLAAEQFRISEVWSPGFRRNQQTRQDGLTKRVAALIAEGHRRGVQEAVKLAEQYAGRYYNEPGGCLHDLVAEIAALTPKEADRAM